MLLAVALFACSRPTPAPGAVVVVMDTTRGDLAGSDLWPFPAECRRYTRAHSAAPWTSTSTLSLVSGRLPVGDERLPPARNYGTWPDNAWPTEVLTDSVVVARLQSGINDAAMKGHHHQPGSPALVSDAVDWLRSAPSEPWALYVHALGPHGPYAGEIEAESSEPGCHDRTGPDRAWCEAGAAGEEPSDDLKAWTRWQYLSSVERSLVAAEEIRAAAPAGSLFIFTSDHGEAMGEDGMWGHSKALHDPQIHVPLVVCGPGVVPGEDSTPVGPLCVAETVTGRGPCDLRTGEGLRAGTAGMLVEGEWVTRDVGAEWAGLADGGSAG